MCCQICCTTVTQNTNKSGNNSIFSIFNPFAMWIYLTVTAKNKVRLLRKFHFAPETANTIYIQGKRQHTNTQFTYYSVIIFNDSNLLFTPSQITDTVCQICALSCSHTAYQTCHKVPWLICRCYSNICDIHHLWDQTAMCRCFKDIRT
jgi:hypothetical protein